MDNSKFHETFRKQSTFDRVRAYTITHPKKSGYAIVNVAYPKDGAGLLRVFVRDFIGPGAGRFSMATASGYGYDKLTAALSRTDGIDGVQFYDHCDSAFDKSKEKKLYIAKAARVAKYLELGRITEKEARDGLQTRANELGISYGGTDFRTGLDRLTAMGYIVIEAI